MLLDVLSGPPRDQDPRDRPQRGHPDDSGEMPAEDVPGFSFSLHDSKADGRLDAEKLVAAVPFEIDRSDLWFCGPPGLRIAIVNGLKKAGKRLARVEYERFEFR